MSQRDQRALAGFKRVRRSYLAICKLCLGSGFQATKWGVKACVECKGTGSVERWLVEVIHDDDTPPT